MEFPRKSLDQVLAEPISLAFDPLTRGTNERAPRIERGARELPRLTGPVLGHARHLDLFLVSGLPKLAQSPSLDLPNPLFGHSHFLADFLERQRLVRMIKPETTNDNLLLALVKPFEDSLDLRLPLSLRRLLLVLIRALILGRRECFQLARAETVAPAVFIRDGAREILHNRPTRISAELIAAGVVKLLNRADQRHIPVADQLEEIVGRTDMPLGD